MWLFARRQKCTMFQLTDIVAPLAPIGLGAGRLGNFINGELWGRVTDVPWAMVFPGAGPQARHPSQLYEALLEGVVLFVIMQFYVRKQRPTMAPTGLALCLYGLFRFIVEFVRMPDAHLGFVLFDWMSMGQILSLPMIIIGAGLVVWAYRKAS
ncbi:MAG: prolipoprotein diacylglyceryl transferase, partial [Methylococcales bacterium]|nr:prolipoprotein diacylglyceryl transferase [Methylococcales bacterium]